jgi:hypothetical protein
MEEGREFMHPMTNIIENLFGLVAMAAAESKCQNHDTSEVYFLRMKENKTLTLIKLERGGE